MAKRAKDMITPETARQVKSMSVPDLNTYLYAIYLAGYNDGMTAVSTVIGKPGSDPPAGIIGSLIGKAGGGDG